MAVTVASLKAVFTADTREFERGAGRVSDRMRGLGDRMSTFGQSMGRLGQNLTLAMAPAAVAFGFSIKKAIEFESAFAGVEKTVDGTDAELAGLRETIRRMATDNNNPLSALDDAHVTLAGIMETAGQLGVPIESMEEFTQVMGELGVATDLTSEEAATLVARIANITGMEFSNVENFGSALVDLGNNAATTESEILYMTSRISAAGSSAGMHEADILGFATALSSVGLTAQLGGGNFSRFINAVTTGVSEGGPLMEELARVSGLTADEFKEMYQNDPTGAITNLIAGLGELEQSEMIKVLEDMGLAGSEMTDVMTRLSGNTDLLEGSLIRANTAWNTNTALTEEARKKAETTEGQMNRLKNNVNDLGITIGSILLPAFNGVIETIQPVITKVSELAAAHPDLIEKVAAVTMGLFGMGVAMTVLGPIVTSLGALLAFGGTALSLAFGLVLSPLGPIVLGVMAGIAAFMLLKSKAGGIASAIKDVIGGALDFAKGVISDVEERLKGLVASLRSFAYDVTYALRGVPGVPDYHQFAPEPTGGPSLWNVTQDFATGLENVPGGASGIMWTGDGPKNQVAGVFHNQEAVVPSGGMSVVPSPRGLMLEGSMGGGGGNVIISGPVYVQGVQDVESLYDEMEQVARRRA